jgi:imidazolonepropionase-like amidohydrolase
MVLAACCGVRDSETHPSPTTHASLASARNSPFPAWAFGFDISQIRNTSLRAKAGVFPHAIQHKLVQPVARPAIPDTQRLKNHQWFAQCLAMLQRVVQREVVSQPSADDHPVQDIIAGRPHRRRIAFAYPNLGYRAQVNFLRRALTFLMGTIQSAIDSHVNPQRKGLMRTGILLVLCSVIFARGISGQSQKPPARTYVLKAAALFDGKSDTLIAPGLVVVTGNRIVAVGAGASAPADAEVIDLGDATLLPGFIDAHTHLSFPYSDDYARSELESLQKTIPERTLDASVNARITLMAGFTTVRDVGSADYIDVGLRNAIAHGDIPGPRMLVAVHALGSTGGHCDDEAGFRQGLFGHESGPLEGVINGPDQARYGVRLNHKYGADVIKVCASGGVLSLTDDVDTPQLTQEELNAIVDEAHALRRKTAAHAHGAEAAKRAIRAGIDSIEHGSFLDDEDLDMMKQRGTYLVPTLMAAQGLQEKFDRNIYIPPAIAAKAHLAINSMHTTFQRALAKGVKIGLGTDAAVYPHGRNAEEFHQMVDLGMKQAAALKAGTSADADLLGLADKIGTLESNKFADIVAVPGNPLQNIRQTEHVFFVMKEGVIYKNEKPELAH